ncbi:MAG: zinc-dependent alcohol dehydrogenase family protein [Acidobacteriota bacterium]|nr:zinc-dependent alcohol dehydrogenase family protein [Blastocatellia bacterium]MDW8411196.1 zinc-dependent alcohol dehydrogenase family protein [Acidobacteriota bacterium]
MLSVKFDRFGDPLDVLRLEEVPMPEPKAGEVLIRLLARPINPSDLMTILGLYGRLPQLPATPGYEAVGEIAALGEGVVGFSVGQRVIPLGIAGTWQEYTVAPVDRLISVPEQMSDATAAQFVVNPLTAWVMVVEELGLRPGDWLLQTAAASALGKIVVQLGKLRGFKTVNVVRRPEQVEQLKVLGADVVICSPNGIFANEVRRLVAAEGVCYAIDAVGGEVGAEVVRSLASHATMLIYGALALAPIPLDVGTMIFKSITIRGFWLADWFERVSLERRIEVMAGVLDLMACGQIVAPVEAEYPLSEVISAVRHATSSGRSGKILLR